MKNIILIFAIVTFSCKSQQTIITVEDYKTYPDEIPDDTYVKDVNNVFNSYVGTWAGEKNGNQYEFIITKVTIISNLRPITRDKLFMRYKITGGLFNTILVDTTTLSDEDMLIIEGSHLDAENNNYVLNYFGVNSQCGQNGTVFLHPNGETQMYFTYRRKGEQADENCTASAEQIMPSYILLNKQ